MGAYSSMATGEMHENLRNKIKEGNPLPDTKESLLLKNLVSLLLRENK